MLYISGWPSQDNGLGSLILYAVIELNQEEQTEYRPDISCYTIALLFCPPFYIHRKTHLICPWHNVPGAQRERICFRSIMAKPSLNCNIGISRSALFLHSATSLPFSPALPPLCPTRSHPVIEISLLGVLTWSTASALITASCRTTLTLHDLAACYVSANCKVCFSFSCISVRATTTHHRTPTKDPQLQASV